MKNLFYFTIAIFSINCFLCGSLAVAQENSTRIVIDNFGRELKVPLKVKKIACMPGPSYEMVFMLGGKNQIGEVRKDHRTAYPLANLTNPDLINYSSSIANINPKARINIEEFIKVAPDVVIYYNVPNAIEKFKEALIPVYTYQPNRKTKSFRRGCRKNTMSS